MFVGMEVHKESAGRFPLQPAGFQCPGVVLRERLPSDRARRHRPRQLV